MLVLSRRVREKLYLGDGIVIQVVEGKDGKMRLGITAPRSLKILRAELLSFAEQAAFEAAAGHADPAPAK